MTDKTMVGSPGYQQQSHWLCRKTWFRDNEIATIFNAYKSSSTKVNINKQMSKNTTSLSFSHKESIDFIIAIYAAVVFIIYAVNWCVSRWHGRDTMDVIIFFISRPGGITRETVWISWMNYFFLIHFFFKYISEIDIIIGILWLKTHYFSQFIPKMGFCCKILSLNDLTPSPISRPGTHCLHWQRANARVNLWHEPFPGETSIALRPCAGKAGVA